MRNAILTLALIACALPGFSPAPAVESAVKIYDSEITIPTYPWATNDINPFFRWTSAHIYPYPMQDNLTRAKVDRTYRVKVVENEYLKVTVIPELGGHVHSVIDKVTGESMLYENKVIKPALIGLRGAWTSGGIEFNTGPQGHTVTCLSPVETTFVDYDDGSKAIVVGNVEQIYHTQWSVSVRLRPGKSYLEERIRIFNPTGNSQLYYFWNCVAMPNTPDTQFIYPMSLGTDHGGTQFLTWPINEGKNISWLKNFDKPSSVFAYRCDKDFYGSYDHKLDRGVIAHANHNDLIGKKSWTWSLSVWGRRAQESLTDDGTYYNEIQTGPLPTQADYGLLDPHQVVEWNEWWYPVRGTKGVTFSNKDVTANVVKDEKTSSLEVFLHGTAKWAAVCSVEGIGEQAVDILPERSSKVVFSLKEAKEPLKISIRSGKNELARFDYPLTIPKRTIPENPRALPSDDTAAGCWLKGVHYDKEGAIHLARQWFEKTLVLDKNFFMAHTSLGELDLDAGSYDSAQEHMEKALKLNGDDGWAAYYLAQAYYEKGMVDDAIEMAYQAVRRVESASAAYSLAGAILLSKKNYAGAIDPLKKSLDKDAKDLVTRDLLAYALWKNGDRDSAMRQLKIVKEYDALDMAASAIAWLIGDEDKESYRRIAGRPDEVLDTADFFMAAGLNDEAARVIEHYYLDPAISSREENPMPYYYYGILANSSQSLKDGFARSPDCVFPNRRSSFKVLEEVVKREPNDWKARYYLGNLYFERVRKDEALKMWNEAIALDDSYSVLHRNIGLVAWKLDGNMWKAIELYEKAAKANPKDVTLCRDLGSLYIGVSQYAKAQEILEKARSMGCIRADVTALLGSVYLQIGEYEKAYKLLLADNYTNWEGQGGLYNLYASLRIAMGEKLFVKGDYEGALKEFQASIDPPKNLGPGKMWEDPESETHYWIGIACDKLGKRDEAVKAWEHSAKGIDKGDERNKKFARASSEILKRSAK